MPSNNVIGFIPQDDRPVCLGEVLLYARLHRMELFYPDAYLLGHRMQPGRPDELLDWLEANITKADCWVLSLDMLAYGGLVASRELSCDADIAANRLIRLKSIHLRFPQVKFFVFQSIRRLGSTVVSSADLETWAENHRRNESTDERKRNHRINILALQLIAEGVFERLHLLQEDARPKGPQLDEQKLLVKLIADYELQHHVLVTTGTDEGALVLLARMVSSSSQKVSLVYSNVEGSHRVPMYEDRMLSVSVRGQVCALGLEVGAEMDTVCFVWCPDRPMRDLVFELPYEDIPSETTAFIEKIKVAIQHGKKVILLDLAYANGADPYLMSRLAGEINLLDLAGFSAWNTTANAAGFALAQSLSMPSKDFLLLRLISDWGYQSVVRPQLNEYVEYTVNDDLWRISPERIPQVEAHLQHLFQIWAESYVQSLPGAQRFSSRLPWERTFEVEITLG